MRPSAVPTSTPSTSRTAARGALAGRHALHWPVVVPARKVLSVVLAEPDGALAAPNGNRGHP